MGVQLTPKSGETVLLYGGSFDPPHRAHIQLPQQAKQAINADHLAFIPVANQPHKQNQTGAKHRLAMLELALANEPDCHILDLEIKRNGPSYTIDTLKELKKLWGNNVILRLLFGADQLANFDRWKDWQQILKLAKPVVMQRPGQLAIRVPKGMNIAYWAQCITQVDRIDISSTDLRNQLANGQPVDQTIVSQNVQQYIQQNHLYLNQAQG